MFPFARICDHLCFNKDLNSVSSVFSVVKYAQNRYGNEDCGPIFSVAEVPLNGIITVARCCSLSLSERNVPFPGELHCFTCTCFTAPHAHVVLSHMCMSYCSTCACRTALHVHLKQRYTPRLHTLLYERGLYPLAYDPPK